MPIVIGPNINPSLIGQASYAAGQGMGALDALRYAGRYGQPQQQDFSLGKMQPTGVQQVSDALANGDLGGDNGLAQDMAIRQGDTGTGSIYDPATSAGQGGASAGAGAIGSTITPASDGGGATLDDDSMQREAAYRQKVAMIQGDESLSDSSKQYALKRLAAKHAMDQAAKPYTYTPSAQTQFNSQLVQHPDGSTYVQQPDGTFTPHEPPPDENPIDPTNPLSMQPTVSDDPTQPPKSQFQQHFEQSIVQNPVTGEMGTWNGSKFTPFEKPKKEAATEKDETRAQFVKEYNDVKKTLTKTDADGNSTEPTRDEILQHMRDTRDAFEEFHGRKAYGNKPQPDVQGGGAPPDEQDVNTQARQMPVPSKDSTMTQKNAAYTQALQLLQSHENYQLAGPAGKDILEKQLHDAIFGE